MEIKQVEKIKIGFFIDTYFPVIDGVIMVVDNYIKRLNKVADVAVFTVMPRNKKHVDELPYKIYRCKRFNLKWLRLDYDLPLPKQDKKFKKAMDEFGFDIIHIHSPFGIGKIGMQYGAKHNIPVVATMHSQYKKDFLRETKSKLLSNIMTKIIMKVFDRCDECWAVNEKTADVFFNEYKAKTYPKIQKNGTEMTPLLLSREQKDLIKEEYNIKKDERVLAFIGRLTNLKNIFFIAEVLNELNINGFKYKMFFIGSGPDEHKLKKMIEEYNLNDKVIFTGKLSDREKLKKLYAVSELIIFPSKYDTDGLVKYEGASQKTPTILLENTTAISGITDGYNGYIGHEDKKEFAKKIVSIFEDEEKYNKVCQNAFESLYTSWDEVVDTAYKKYLKIIQRKKQYGD